MSDAIVIAGASQTWPEFRVSLARMGSETFTQYEILTELNGTWHVVDRETYLDALATSQLSASQDLLAHVLRFADRGDK